jgi:hypothetical protein
MMTARLADDPCVFSITVDEFSQMQKNANRYLWLKRQHDSAHCSWHVRNGYTGLAAKNIPDDLDAEIDAAMKEE